MRILQVNHKIPPFSRQGSEQHCLHLSQALAAQGHDVGVFHISNTRHRRPYRLEQRNGDGLRIFHCIDGGGFSRLADWPNPFLRRAFRQTLQTFAPEVVHFHNYLSLGDPVVTMARDFGAAVVYTLHDYGLICPNHLLLQTDGRLCDKADPGFFGGCCPLGVRSRGGRTPLVAKHVPPLPRWERFAARQSNPLARSLLAAGVWLAKRLVGEPAETAFAAKRDFFLGRTREILETAHVLIAPSRFLRERFVQCGVPPERIVHQCYGLRLCDRRAHQPSADGRPRFGYLGGFHPHKGIDVLVRGFAGLAGRASLHLHGSSFGSPMSEAYFRQATAGLCDGVTVHGPYANDDIAAILSRLDALVVPSVWHENSPLTIQEAQVAGVPVITSDHGGMAELVRDGIDGRLFRLGDSADLGRVLRELIEQPAELDRLRRNAPAVPSIAQTSAEIVALYRSALERARSCACA